jgi:hypothetical protein
LVQYKVGVTESVDAIALAGRRIDVATGRDP